jgi:preprotein translocase subunit SecA
VPHNVLNARYHEQEAHIIAQAGRPGAVTIATNMAGRGTDIQLGGNLDMRLHTELATIKDTAERERRAAAIREEIETAHEAVVQAGGLFVVGSERHESRRIDNQLRGRSGRQGDPGASKFFVSLEDDLMRIFGSERMDSMLQRLGLKEGEAIIHPWVNKALAKAQQKVEARNYDVRKQLLKFDDVMNDQRKVVYEQRREIMNSRDVAVTIADMRNETIDEIVAVGIPDNALAEQWDVAGLHAECVRLLAVDLPLAEWAREDGIDRDEVRERIMAAADRRMAEKSANAGPELMRMAEKSLLLQLLDQIWKDHLLSLDHLRQGINLRAYAQRDPLNEYKREAFELFQGMLVNLRQQVTSVLSHIELRVPQPAFAEAVAETDEEMAEERLATGTTGRPLPNRPRVARRPSPANGADGSEQSRAAGTRAPWSGTSRNAPCPCGSGRKFKHCHGRV